jgi:hypothetical protein
MGLTSYLLDEVSLILFEDDSIKPHPEPENADDPTGYDAYASHCYDESLLHLEGEPVRWKIRRLTYDQRKRADDITSASERVEFLLRCGLLAITGYESCRPSGTKTPLSPIVFEESQQWGREIVKLSWLREANLPPRYMMKVAMVIRSLSEAVGPFSSN